MSESTTTSQGTARPLLVRLDGALLASDLAWEALLDLARRRPGGLAGLPGVLLSQGRAGLWRRVSRRSGLDLSRLPYRPEVLGYLEEQRASGRRLILVTPVDEGLARRVADHLGVFDGVIAGEGAAALEAARELCGEGGFDYLGGPGSDPHLWREAAAVSLTGRGSPTGDREPERTFPAGPGRLKAAARAMRPHQWVKNVLLFVPLLTSHRLGEPREILRALVAFAAFSATASSVYLLNDLLDLESDRRHPRKRFRPLAAGTLSIPAGLGLACALLVLAAGLASPLPPLFGLLLLGYMALTTAYSAVLKRKPMVDVIALAGLYTHRILAGGAATSIVISPWLLGFSTFFFLSLAFAKRYTELAGHLEQDDGRWVPGRGYLASDLDVIRAMGPASGYLSVLVLSLYINSPDVTVLYRSPQVLWLLCPLLLYWVSRLWLLAHRGDLPHDPIVFTLRDRISYAVGAIAGVILVLASIF